MQHLESGCPLRCCRGSGEREVTDLLAPCDGQRLNRDVGDITPKATQQHMGREMVRCRAGIRDDDENVDIVVDLGT